MLDADIGRWRLRGCQGMKTSLRVELWIGTCKVEEGVIKSSV